MARKILRSDKHVFWEALVITLFIFGCGILLGVFIENSRAGDIQDLYDKSEVNYLDVKLQSEIYSLQDLDCELAIQENIEYGDRIYQDALVLQRYEDAGRITDSLIQEHRKYDLLRTMFWLNSIKIKERCSGFHSVVYLYEYNLEDIEKRSEQEIFSRFLADLKDEYEDEIVLIPIAYNLDLTSVDLMRESYDIEGTSIIVDEDLVVSSVDELDKIREYLG